MARSNTECSILFLQAEHGETLKALHTEISKLQKKCTDLTFQMAMGETPSQDNTDELESKIAQLDSDLRASQADKQKLHEEAERNAKKIHVLEQRIRAQEKKFLDQLKEKDHIVYKLQKDVESKSTTIAYLTTELHKSKVKLRGSGGRVPGGDGDHIPAPPQDGAPRPRRPRRDVTMEMSVSRSAGRANSFNEDQVSHAVHIKSRLSDDSLENLRVGPHHTSDHHIKSNITSFLTSHNPIEVHIKPSPVPLPPIGAQGMFPNEAILSMTGDSKAQQRSLAVKKLPSTTKTQTRQPNGTDTQ